jgi:predicted metal-binding protein
MRKDYNMKEQEDLKALEALFMKYGHKDFKWIKPADIVVSQWVRMKCMFGCSDYSRNASCPPNTPSVAECRQFFNEYNTVVVFHFPKALDKPEDRGAWSRKVNQSLLKLEREVFLLGYQKAFLLFMDCCRICNNCPGKKAECKSPENARPSAEAMAIDVFSTVRKYELPITVLSDYSQPMNRYAFLFIE